MARTTSKLKTLLVGRPKDTAHLEHERLSKKVGLAVFASDNLSSSAYATEEMLVVLLLGGTMALRYSILITLMIVGVLTVIAVSYRETIHAYPSGGGAYIVAHDNLGRYPGLIAASALLIDYVLTVSVSISAGVDNVLSAAPQLDNYRVHLAVGVIAFMTLMNLRGVRESGRIFAIPTYLFILFLGGTIVWGFVRYFVFGFRAPVPPLVPAEQGITLLLLMRAFSHGSTAVTGIEAISNGVPAFREPAARNAATTLAAMAAILGSLFVGITILAHVLHITGPEEEPRRTVVARLAITVFGDGPLAYAVLGATFMILFLAANTSYADFPRLSAALAKDRFAPRQLMNRGDRLAFSNGIVGLAALACVLVVVFRADVSRLINLYVVGVFTSLTLSQLGMVRHWRRLKGQRPWRHHAVVNGVGAAATFIVLGIVLATKFLDGAWMVVLGVPVVVFVLDQIHRHYTFLGAELRRPERRPPPGGENHVVLLVGRPSEEERRAFAYAERIRTESFRCVHFAEPGDPKGLEAQWARQIGLLPTAPALEIVRTDGGGLGQRLRDHLEHMRRRIAEHDFVTVIVSERIRAGPVRTIGSRRAFLIKTALLFTRGVVVTDVPFLVGAEQTVLDPAERTRHVVVVLVSAVHNATLKALEYAKTLDHDELHAVHVVLDPEAGARHAREWQAAGTGLALELVESPYRRLVEPIKEYVRGLNAAEPAIVTVILPEFVVRKWWHHFLHNQNGLSIKWSFLLEPDVIVTSVPYRLG